MRPSRLTRIAPLLTCEANIAVFVCPRKRFPRITAADFVTIESGTGAVHEAPAFGDHAFLWVNTVTVGGATLSRYRIATLEDGPDDEVILKHYFRMDGAIEREELATLTPADLRRTEGCDYVFHRRASQFRGRQAEGACRFEWEGREVFTDNSIELSEADLVFHDHKFDAASGERTRL